MKKSSFVFCAALLAVAMSASANVLVVQSGDNEETYLRNNFPDYNYGSSATMQVGYSASEELRGLLRFDVSILDGLYSSINSATVKLNLQAVWAGDYDASVFQVADANAGWVGGTVSHATPGADGESTWNALAAQAGTGNGMTNWVGSVGMYTAGTDYVTPAMDTVTLTSANVGNWIEFTIDPALVEHWLSSGSNAGLLFTSATDGGIGGAFWASDYDGGGPQLVIDYTPLSTTEVPSSVHAAAGVEWPSTSTNLYQVQYKGDLVLPSSWTALGDPVVGSGSTNSVLDSTFGEDKRFYRVVIFGDI